MTRTRAASREPRAPRSVQTVLAAECFQRALALNALFPQSWFALGCAYMITEQWTDALAAFSRVVALATDVRSGAVNLCAAGDGAPSMPAHGQENRPDLDDGYVHAIQDGEAWSNIAAVQLRLGQKCVHAHTGQGTMSALTGVAAGPASGLSAVRPSSITPGPNADRPAVDTRAAPVRPGAPGPRGRLS